MIQITWKYSVKYSICISKKISSYAGALEHFWSWGSDVFTIGRRGAKGVKNEMPQASEGWGMGRG